MKKIASLLFAVYFFCSASLAFALTGIPEEAKEVLNSGTTFIHYGDFGLPIAELQFFLGISYVNDDIDTEPHFDSTTFDAVLDYQAENGLVQTGCFDPETLRLLLFVPESAYEEEIVWIPMHGGSKLHKSETCSGMDEPRQMPLDCADRLGFNPCKKCYD